jgi:serine/threonine protein phosphatase 1
MVGTQHKVGAVFPAAPPRVADGRRVYAVGDIHGRADLLERLHGLIRADVVAAPKRRNVLVYLGDYIDRGTGSSAVVEMLIERPLEGFEAVHLKGNHEDFLLGFLDDHSIAANWVLNGAMETLRSYGVAPLDMMRGTSGQRKVQRALAAAVPPHHLAFFRTLETRHVEGDYVFVHAGLRPGVSLKDQREIDLLWIRGEFLSNESFFPKFVVHGHTSRREPEVRANRINIDTRAYHSNRLTCLVLDGADRRFLRT